LGADHTDHRTHERRNRKLHHDAPRLVGGW
jgi:hypothetical protein